MTVKTTPLESLISGSLSSAITTVMFQPLELLKTRIQLQGSRYIPETLDPKTIGRSTRSMNKLIRTHNLRYLWRGTGASLVRSIPGVGLYYATLNILQDNFASQKDRPDNSTQAFYFGLTVRSFVSITLLPVTVVKVRYESGQYAYTNLNTAIKEAYVKNGWVGAAPTILRDSLFSGIYYMCYTSLKTTFSTDQPSISPPYINFVAGLFSGLVASVITNPLDVIKTSIQVANKQGYRSTQKVVLEILKQQQGFIRLFDGLAPRTLRRTLVSASTWTFYEFFVDYLK